MSSTSLRESRTPLLHSTPETSRSSFIPFYDGGELSFTFYMSTLLVFSATLFSVVSIICFLADLQPRIIFPVISLLLSFLSHLGGALFYGFTSLAHLEYHYTSSSVHLEWKGKDWKKALSNRNKYFKGENAKNARLGLAFWNFCIGLVIIIGAIHATTSPWLQPESVAGVCFTFFTAAIHILLVFPPLNNCRVAISLSSITDEKALVEEEGLEGYHDSEEPLETRPVETHSVV